MPAALAWLRRRAENIAAGLLAVMFLAFLAQIALRYLTSFPIGWTAELTVVCWLWLVLFGSAFVLTEREEIGAVGERDLVETAGAEKFPSVGRTGGAGHGGRSWGEDAAKARSGMQYQDARRKSPNKNGEPRHKRALPV